ncbi:MAG: type II toxin-antitoxin system HicB family antitoxin [Phycisphaerae bacterium]
MKYAIILEKGEKSFGAYVPDLPGCVAVGKTEAQTRRLIHEAIELHLEDMKARGQKPPKPHSKVEFFDLKVA